MQPVTGLMQPVTGLMHPVARAGLVQPCHTMDRAVLTQHSAKVIQPWHSHHHRKLLIQPVSYTHLTLPTNA